MRNIIKISALILLLIFSISAIGKNVTIMGGANCVDWIKSKKESEMIPSKIYSWIPYQDNKSWAAGYASGYNSSYPSKKNLLEGVNSKIIFDWIDMYCLKNPKDDVPDAIGNMIDILEKKVAKSRK